LIDKNRRAVLADFGLSTILANRSDLVSTVCGSWNFLAPEVSETAPFDAMKADVWALGITIYFMLVGELPPVNGYAFKNGTDTNLKKLVMWMLTPDSTARPNASELLMTPFFHNSHCPVPAILPHAPVKPGLQRPGTPLVLIRTKYRTSSTGPVLSRFQGNASADRLRTREYRIPTPETRSAGGSPASFCSGDDGR
jgi:serine/threonine protein kinase